MGTKARGFYKGLKYISQIFVVKERELEIGHPTDVKHVAHIGWDGPSGNGTPGWMNEFKRAPDFTMPVLPNITNPVLEKSKAQKKQKCRKSKSVSSSSSSSSRSSSRVGKTKSKYAELGQIPSLQTEGTYNQSKQPSMKRNPISICIS